MAARHGDESDEFAAMQHAASVGGVQHHEQQRSDLLQMAVLSGGQMEGICVLSSLELVACIFTLWASKLDSLHLRLVANIMPGNCKGTL